MEMVLSNIKMAFIMKEILVKIKDTEWESFFTKINSFIWGNGKRVNFMEKAPYFTT